jgi:hypothetical protein
MLTSHGPDCGTGRAKRSADDFEVPGRGNAEAGSFSYVFWQLEALRAIHTASEFSYLPS